MKKKVLIISKLDLHKMCTKPKLGSQFMQKTSKFVASKIIKVANFAVQYLKTPNFSPGYALELNCSYRAYAYATESPGPTFPHFWSYSACKNDVFAPFTAVLTIQITTVRKYFH